MREIRIIESIYSPGRPRKYIEDGHFIKLPFFGVIDGFSAPYNPCDEKNTMVLFNELSGGEMVRDIILTTFSSTCPDLSLESVAIGANKEIAKTQAFRNVSLGDAGCLAGASAVLGEIYEDRIEIIQAGDCYAVWLYESGEIGITENKFYKFNLQGEKKFSDLLKKYQDDKLKIWQDYCSFLFNLRHEHANKDYPIFNGQPSIQDCWQKIELPLKNLKLLILLTDGLISLEQMADEKKLAKDIIELYQSTRSSVETGLNRILVAARVIERMNSKNAHEKQAEATGMAIRFE